MITVTTACPPVEDLRWAREHDIPMLKGIAARACAPWRRACTTERRVPPARDVHPARAAGGRRRAGRARLGRDRRAPTACPTCARSAARRADEAVAAAERIGYPVVVKIDNVAHKARVGGVALNLLDAAQVRDAAERMGGAVIVAEQVARRRRGAGRDGARPGLRADRRGRHRRRAGRGARPRHRQPRAARSRRRARAGGAACPRSTKLLGGEPPDGLIDAIVAVSRAGGRASRDRGDRRQPAAGVTRARRRARLPDRPEGKESR